ADLGIALFQQALVALGDRVDRVDCRGLPLRLVPRELLLAGLAVPHAGEAPGQAQRIVDAAVESHAAQGVVDVCGVPREEDTSSTIGRGYALAHAIERAHHDLVGLVARQQVLQTALD